MESLMSCFSLRSIHLQIEAWSSAFHSRKSFSIKAQHHDENSKIVKSIVWKQKKNVAYRPLFTCPLSGTEIRKVSSLLQIKKDWGQVLRLLVPQRTRVVFSFLKWKYQPQLIWLGFGRKHHFFVCLNEASMLSSGMCCHHTKKLLPSYRIINLKWKTANLLDYLSW